MRRVASMPLMPGRLMSINTRPGASESNNSTASSPDSASPITSNPGVAAITIFAARRNGAWSSTISTPTAPELMTTFSAGQTQDPRLPSRSRLGRLTPSTSRTSRVVGGEVDQHRLYAAVPVGLLRERELREQRVDVLLHRAFREPERAGYSCVVPALRHLGQ